MLQWAPIDNAALATGNIRKQHPLPVVGEGGVRGPWLATLGGAF
jgi:hypothetical protein